MVVDLDFLSRPILKYSLHVRFAPKGNILNFVFNYSLLIMARKFKYPSNY